MSNPRDTGRYDAFTDSYVDTNVRVDFAWGNIPMQPNDDRGEDILDPGLDSHIIAVSEYEGFPAFTTGAPFDDTIPNATVPNVVGLLSAAAKSAINDAGLNWSMTTTTNGATELLDDKIKSQSPEAGAVVNAEDTVSIVAYDYVAPGPVTTGPISGFNRNIPPLTNWALNGNQSIMYLVGRTVRPSISDHITVSGSSDASHNVIWIVEDVLNDDTYNTGGTAVKVTLDSGFISQNTSSGGTWTKN